MPFKPAFTASRSISTFISPIGRAQPSITGVAGSALRVLSKNIPISSNEGGVTFAIAVFDMDISTTNASSLGG